MKRFRIPGLALLVLLALALLLLDFQAAYTADNANTQQSVATAKVDAAPMGRSLRVYVGGDGPLVRELKQQIKGAILAPEQESPFESVLLDDAIPADSYEMPFLAILIDQNRGFWTPVWAARHVTATLLYAQGRPVDREKVVPASPTGEYVNFTGENCRGACVEARRTVELDATIRGLVSLPHVSAYTAGKLAKQAVTLVTDSLPENLNPAKWSDRAFKLAREAVDSRSAWFSFQRQPGCRGGLVLVGDTGGSGAGTLLYYDANQDAITDRLSRSDLQAKLPGVSVPDTLGLGTNEKGLAIYLSGGTFATIPAGTCGLSGWQLEGPAASQK
jgi:hypothetical protein